MAKDSGSVVPLHSPSTHHTMKVLFHMAVLQLLACHASCPCLATVPEECPHSLAQDISLSPQNSVECLVVLEFVGVRSWHPAPEGQVVLLHLHKLLPAAATTAAA